MAVDHLRVDAVLLDERPRLVVEAMSYCPAHAVIPLASRPSLTLNSEAMKTTTAGSPTRQYLAGADYARG